MEIKETEFFNLLKNIDKPVFFLAKEADIGVDNKNLLGFNTVPKESILGFWAWIENNEVLYSIRRPTVKVTHIEKNGVFEMYPLLNNGSEPFDVSVRKRINKLFEDYFVALEKNGKLLFTPKKEYLEIIGF